MRREPLAFLLITGLTLIAISMAQSSGHEGAGGVILIGPIPIIFGSSPEMAVGAMILAGALMALSLSFMIALRRMPWDDGTAEMDGDARGTKTERKGGAVVMIGPIPVVLGSDPRTAAMLMIIALGLMLVWALYYRVLSP